MVVAAVVAVVFVVFVVIVVVVVIIVACGCCFLTGGLLKFVVSLCCTRCVSNKIVKITVAQLFRLLNTFYVNGNRTLVVCGPADKNI